MVQGTIKVSDDSVKIPKSKLDVINKGKDIERTILTSQNTTIRIASKIK